VAVEILGLSLTRLLSVLQIKAPSLIASRQESVFVKRQNLMGKEIKVEYLCLNKVVG
jgi:hypothetical protein